MDMLHEVARWSHIGVGTLAFASLWTAAFTRKGGFVHRRAGTTYVWTMTFVLLSAGVWLKYRYLPRLGHANPRSVAAIFLYLVFFVKSS